ncbi:aminotransferase class IV [Pedobacter xixiisoli]|uniref:branched-chain-amino-acid transaminase n=1 Tax=Pedobacter xixiisoli TaxID=1476464 RepID=A0A285ZNE7_9SPHI|nr:aminotransferase class IV [Pedobacter xixiisoli]SOD11169.1 D-alanine transaminase/branched-chain amino acid aminotransferase [Pedobacter xixiisoli]
MNHKYIYLNGQLVSEDEAKLSVTDLAIQRGYGIFDFLKIIKGKPIFIEDYFDRFYNSANEMNLEIDLERKELHAAVNSLLAKNNIPNSSIKLILTGGYSEDGYQIAKPNLAIIQSPFEYDQASFYKGLNLVSHNYQRQFPAIKTIDYLQAIRLQSLLSLKESDDLLYHNNGKIRECPRANIFIVKDNEVITPSTAVLRGITRSKILGIKLNGITIKERNLYLKNLIEADEAFVTSSTKNVLPVLSLDGKPIGDGKPGKITSALSEKLLEMISNH